MKMASFRDWLRRRKRGRDSSKLKPTSNNTTLKHDPAQQKSGPRPPSYDGLYSDGPTYHNLGSSYWPVTPHYRALIAGDAARAADRVVAAAAAVSAASAPAVAATHAEVITQEIYSRADRLAATHTYRRFAGGYLFANAAAIAAAAHAAAAAIARASAADTGRQSLGREAEQALREPSSLK